MTYYVTKTSPLIFATEKAEKVTEATIEQMLLLLMTREFQEYEPQDAVNNLNQWLQEETSFLSQWEGGQLTVPSKWKEVEMPKEQEMMEWINNLLQTTEAGNNLLRQVGQPLTKADKEVQEYLNDQTTLSDLLEGMASPSEMDSAGPMLHSPSED